MEIRFSFETKYGTYSDALLLPDDHNYTDQEIDDMKISRRDSWLTVIDASQIVEEESIVETPTPEPTPESTPEE